MTGAYWAAVAVVGGEIRTGLRIVHADGVVTALADAPAPAPGDVRLPGVVLPAFANAHSHAFQRVLRARTHGSGGTFWTWRELMYRAALTLQPDTYLELATAVFAEMALGGYAVVGEFHYLHHDLGGRPYSERNAMGLALVEAAQRAGVRLTLIDTAYLSGGIDENGDRLPLSPGQQRFDDGSICAWAERHTELRERLRGHDRVRVAAAVHSVRAVPPEAYADFLAATPGERIHAHVSEQPGENAQVLAAYGRTPVRVLSDGGLLEERLTAVHLTHLSREDLALMAASGAIACFCPSTERDLADGIGPARELADRGAAIAIGSDQHTLLDPFAELRGLEHGERLASGERGRFAPAELMTIGTANGYRSLGWGGGTLAVGEPCDLVAVRDDSARTAGAAPDQLLYAASSADVSELVVGGRSVVTGGRHRLGDVGRLLSDAIARLGRSS